MEYKGKYKPFDPAQIKTYPIRERQNKVKYTDLIDPLDAIGKRYQLSSRIRKAIDVLATDLVEFRQQDKPVILFTGAHLVKNGLGRIIIELVKRELVTLVAGNGATAIHDFELALIGETSEHVPSALEEGQFGMAYEFSYQNMAIQLGNQAKLGYGESLGRMMCNDLFRREVLSFVRADTSPTEFAHPDVSIIAACYEKEIPFTVHTGIGTDVIDQHPSFNGDAKGGCSGRDFLIYTNEVCKLSNGGVILNIGSAVTGPEVFLKAASMAANTGHRPENITSADFDIRPMATTMTDESTHGYYFRDQKSVVTRVPAAFNGSGLYIEGNVKLTIPCFFQAIMNKLAESES